MTPLRHRPFCWACAKTVRHLRLEWRLKRLRLLVLLRLPPRIFIIFSGAQIFGWCVATLFEIFDPSSFSGTVNRVREFIPAWLVLSALLPLMLTELAIGLFEFKEKRVMAFAAGSTIFWWAWLAALMLIVEPKNIAAFSTYAITAFFRAWAFASTALPEPNEKGEDAADLDLGVN